MGMAASIVLTVIGLVSAPAIAGLFDEPRIVPLLRVMLLMLPVAALVQVPDVIMQRNLDFRRIAHIDWISAIVSGGLGVAAALGGFGLWALVVQFVASYLTTALLRQAIVRWRPRAFFDVAVSRRLLTYGSSIVAIGLVNYAVVNIDNALIGAKIGAAALGYYMLAYNLVLLPATNVGGLVGRVMFPALSSLRSDPGRFVRAYTRMLRLVAVVTFPLIVGLGVTAPIAIPLIYGPQWEPTVTLLQILTAIGIFQAVNVSGVAYSAIGRPHLLLAWATVSLVVMTVGFAIGARWGVTGVAWSYLIVSPVVGLPPHLIVNRLIGLRQKEFIGILGAPLLAALTMGGVILIVRGQTAIASLANLPQLLFLTLLGGATYAATLFLLAYGSGRKPLQWITSAS